MKAIQLEAVGDTVVRAILIGLLTKRAELKEAEDKLKASKSEINESIRKYYIGNNFESVTSDDFGTLTVFAQQRQVLDKKKLKMILANKGVGISIITAAFEESTTTTESESVRYTPPKE